jgi:hypothetical protein
LVWFRIWAEFVFAFSFGMFMGWILFRTENPTRVEGIFNASITRKIETSHDFLSSDKGKDILYKLESILSKEGPKQFLRQLSVWMNGDPEISTFCHPIAHSIGRNALVNLGFHASLEGMIGNKDARILRTCNAAYMHGIIEQYIEKQNNLLDAASFIQTNLCDTFPNPYDQTVASNKAECEHGIGHGIFHHIRTQHDSQTILEALSTCGNATTDTRSCQNGVWMDYFASTRISTITLKPESLHICDSLSYNTVNTWDCLIYAPTEYLLHNPGDYAGAIQFCSAGLDHPETCILGVGSQAGKENMLDLSIVENACLSANTPYQDRCFKSALEYYAMSTGIHSIPPSLFKNLIYFRRVCLNYA